MLERDLTIDPAAERKQLLFLVAGLPLVAALLWWWLGAVTAPIVLLVLAAIALAGVLAYQYVGRDVFLWFNVIAIAIGAVVSRFVVFLLYGVAICAFGSVLRVLGVDRLRKNFARNRRRDTMLHDASATTAESFLRQS